MKKTIVSVLVLFLFCSTSWAATYYPLSRCADQGGSSASYCTKSIVDAIGATKGATIHYRHDSSGTSTTYAFGTSETIPDNVRVIVDRGAVLTIATGKTLTVNGPFDAGVYQTFSCVGTGAVSFGGKSVGDAYPQWFGAIGDGVTDDADAIQLAVDSLVSGQALNFGVGSYRISRSTGTNDRWGINVKTSGITLKGNGSSIRRYNTDISTYALAYPVILIGTPDSNVVAAVTNIAIEGLNFTGENTQHATPGSSLHDGRYAIEIKNASGVKIRNNKFTAIDSAAVYMQKPAVYDYANSAYYNTTKVYNVDISNNSFVATAHAVAGRSLIHAISGGADHVRIENNYFEWCDDAVSMSSTYDDLNDVETDTYTDSNLGEAVKRVGRGMVITGNMIYNSSEHAFYMGTMDTVISNNVIRTDNIAVCTVGNIKVQGRNVSITGNTITTDESAIEIRDTAFNVSVSGNTVYSNGNTTGGVIEISPVGITTFITNRSDYLGSYYAMANISITGNTVILPSAANTVGVTPDWSWEGIAIRVYSDSADANYPEGQIKGVAISGNTIKNHQIGVAVLGNLIKNVSIDSNTFDAKTFTSSGFDNTTTLNTYAALMVGAANTTTLQQVKFSDNKIWGSTYVFATESGGGTSVHLPYGIYNNNMSYCQNFATTDFRTIQSFNKFSGNRGSYFLDGKAASTFTSGDLSRATHDYGAGVVAWTLSTVEAAADYLVVTNASGGVDALLTATTFIAGKTYNILNTSGQVLTFKRTTGGTIANGKLGIYLAGAADVVEVYEEP